MLTGNPSLIWPVSEVSAHFISWELASISCWVEQKPRGVSFFLGLSLISETKGSSFSLHRKPLLTFSFRPRFCCPQSSSGWRFSVDEAVLQTTGKLGKLYLIIACVSLCVLQNPTARQCGWWCLWCACQWWPSLSSSLSSSAPWDTTAACRAPRVSVGVTPVPAHQSTHRHCSFHDIITNLSLCQLFKRGKGVWFEEGVCSNYAKCSTSFFSFRLHESKQSLHTHDPAHLFLMKQTGVADFDVSAVFVTLFIPTVSRLLPCDATFILK